MTMIVMPSAHPVSASFSIAGYGDVDGVEDAAAYFGYLDSMATIFRDVIAAGLDQMRLQPGDAVLDVGCGLGTTAGLIARRVGPRGRVVGLDASRAMIAQAQQRFNPRELPIEFQVGDALALPFAAAMFDAARTERVFMFLEEPARALAELVRVTKPGGRIVVTEGDIGSHSVDTDDVAMTHAVLAALADCSPSGCVGRRLRAMFVDAGMRDIVLHLAPILTTSFTEWNRRLGVERCLSAMIEEGRVTRERAFDWLSELRTRDAQDRFTGTAMLYQVAGTKAGS